MSAPPSDVAQLLRDFRTRSGLTQEVGVADGGRLDALTGPGGVVNKTIAISLAALSAGKTLDVAAVEAFPMLALFDGGWFPLRAAAKVLGRSLDETEELVDSVVDHYGAWDEPAWFADAEDLSDRERILEWLDVELPNLVRLVRAASEGDSGDQLAAVRSSLGMLLHDRMADPQGDEVRELLRAQG